MKHLMVIGLILMLVTPIFAQSRIIYNRNNEPVEKWIRSGNRTDVYDARSNELEYTRYHQGNKVYLRDTSNYEFGVEYEGDRD